MYPTVSSLLYTEVENLEPVFVPFILIPTCYKTGMRVRANAKSRGEGESGLFGSSPAALT